MNRVIKFRAWDHHTKEMVSHECLSVVAGEGAYIMEETGGSLIASFRDNTLELMQFTGLQDSAGVDIYEGDILDEGHPDYFTVEWDDEWAKFKLQHPRNSYSCPGWNRGELMRVIGNIHENPELLNSTDTDKDGG
ncbi:MAG: hypothetical protein GY938_32660 [Ketobacter sp.]|nr:hypothetical protein [Ketobacter sp.]